MRRGENQLTSENAFSFRRFTAVMLLVAQALFVSITNAHLRSTELAHVAIGLSVPANDAPVVRSSQDLSSHDPATCPICLTQNLDRGLTASIPTPETASLLITTAEQWQSLSFTTTRHTTLRARAPPSHS